MIAVFGIQVPSEPADSYADVPNFLWNIDYPPVTEPRSVSNKLPSDVQCLSECIHLLKKHFGVRFRMTLPSNSIRYQLVLSLLLLLCGDVELNPGPPVTSHASSPSGDMNLNPSFIIDYKSKRTSETTTDWNKCMICQEMDGNLTLANEANLCNFRDQFMRRKRFNDAKYNFLFERLGPIIENDDIMNHSPKWHYFSCYAPFVKSTNIARAENHALQPNPFSTKTKNKRTKSKLTKCYDRGFDPEKCLICQVRKPKLPKPSKICDDDVCEEFLRMKGVNENVKKRLTTRDPRGLLYHCSCYLKEQRKIKAQNITPETKSECQDQEAPVFSTKSLTHSGIYEIAFSRLLREIDPGLQKGHAYSVDALTKKFRELVCRESHDEKYHCQYPNWRLQERLLNHYGESILAIKPEKSTESAVIMARRHISVRTITANATSNDDRAANVSDDIGLHQLGKEIRERLSKTPGMTDVTAIHENTVQSIVPQVLYDLLRVILCGDNRPSDEDHRRIVNIAQDVVYAHDRRKLTPKHLGVATSIHKATRSKKLIDLLHAAGSSIGYDTLLRVETSLAQHEIDRFVENDETVIPEALDRTGGFISFAADNIDHNEETVDGKGTFHATNMCAFQESSESGIASKHEQPVLKGRQKYLTSIPEKLNEVEVIEDPKKVDPPSNFHFYKLPSPQSVISSARRTLAWLLSWTFSGDNTPNWTNFQKAFQPSASDTTQKVTRIGYMPILNATASDFSTIHTTIKRCQKIAKNFAQKHTVITFDEPLYAKAKELIWSNPGAYKNVILRLGGFHIALDFLKVIGSRFNCSGLEECWVEAQLFGRNTAEKALNGKHYNRSVRSVKLTLEALWEMLIEVIHKDETLPTDFKVEKDWSTAEELEAQLTAITHSINRFDKVKKDGTSALWRSYIDMALILLNFIQADRQRDWNLHLLSLEQMLPYFF